MTRGRAFYGLVAVLLLFVIIDVAVADWLLSPPLRRVYVVQPGETLAVVASRFHLHPQAIVDENNLRPGVPVQPGQVLSIPTAPLGPFLNWRLQLAGLLATLLGGLLALWLCTANSVLPTPSGGAEMAMALLLATVHYAAVQANTTSLAGAVTPAFILASIVDGFAWTTVLPLLARALRHVGQQE